MGKISDYIDFSESPQTIITILKQKTVTVPSWDKLRKDYNFKEHAILTDHENLRDKIRADGTVEKSARLSIGLERLLVKRISEFMFAIPVKREYRNIDKNPIRQKIADAIDSVYKYARIDTHNKKRSKRYFGCCEIGTLWYAVKKENTLYGFNSKFKLKCKTFCPMDGVELYPLFDDYDDMIAFSIQYSVTKNNKTHTYFETWTDTMHYKWEESDGWHLVSEPEEIVILKIPLAYLHREEAIYEEVSGCRKEIEYTLSRNCNVIAYNSAPILKVIGDMNNGEKKGEDYRLFRMQKGGDVAYVAWQQAIEALRYNVSELKELFWSLSQMPDISFSNMQKLGNIGYDARETLLTDAHLKVGDEEGEFIEFFDRETNIIKAFLVVMNKEFAKEIDNVEVKHSITPFIQKNEEAEINKRMKANGGKPIESHLESIARYGMNTNAQETLDQIHKEEAEEASINSIPDIFGSGR
ncbi:MAG: phage portal protein [Muribaculaceae bacterium]|nr:phage portal protein [Muribaculaceae bacterium]